MSYSISIPEYDKRDDYIDYVLLVTDQQTGEIWNFRRRYSILRKLSDALKRFTKDLQFPGKKVFGSKSTQFLDQRKVEIQKYFMDLLKIPGVSQSQIFQEFIKPNDRKILKDSKHSLQSNRRNTNKSNEEIEQAIKSVCNQISEDTTSRFLDLGAHPNAIQDEDAKRRVNEFFRAANNITFEYSLALPEGANINGTHIEKPIADHKQFLERMFSELVIIADEKQAQESLISKFEH